MAFFSVLFALTVLFPLTLGDSLNEREQCKQQPKLQLNQLNIIEKTTLVLYFRNNLLVVSTVVSKILFFGFHIVVE